MPPGWACQEPCAALCRPLWTGRFPTHPPAGLPNPGIETSLGGGLLGMTEAIMLTERYLSMSKVGLADAEDGLQ
jgi:hypothetical protein